MCKILTTQQPKQQLEQKNALWCTVRCQILKVTGKHRLILKIEVLTGKWKFSTKTHADIKFHSNYVKVKIELLTTNDFSLLICKHLYKLSLQKFKREQKNYAEFM